MWGTGYRRKNDIKIILRRMNAEHMMVFYTLFEKFIDLRIS